MMLEIKHIGMRIVWNKATGRAQEDIGSAIKISFI